MSHYSKNMFSDVIETLDYLRLNTTLNLRTYLQKISSIEIGKKDLKYISEILNEEIAGFTDKDKMELVNELLSIPFIEAHFLAYEILKANPGLFRNNNNNNKRFLFINHQSYVKYSDLYARNYLYLFINKGYVNNNILIDLAKDNHYINKRVALVALKSLYNKIVNPEKLFPLTDGVIFHTKQSDNKYVLSVLDKFIDYLNTYFPGYTNYLVKN